MHEANTSPLSSLSTEVTKRLPLLDVLRGFAWLGRMALTNHIVGGTFTVWLFLGPTMLGRQLGLSYSLLLGVVFFAIQMLFSHWWLTSHKLNPLEWLWRYITYSGRG